MKTIYLIIIIVFSPFYTITAQDSTKVLLPTTTLFKKHGHSNFTISPSGKYYAEIVDDAFNSDIVIIDIDAYAIHKKFSFGNNEVDDLIWLNDNRILYQVAGEINALDIDGTNPTVIIDQHANKEYKNWYHYYSKRRYNTVLSLKGKSEDEILIESINSRGFADVYSVNIFTGAKYTIAQGTKDKINSWQVDKDGKVRLGIAVNDDGIKFYDYGEELNVIQPLKLAIGNSLESFDINATSYLDQSVFLESFDYDENILYLSSNLSSDKRELLKYDLASRKVVETLIKDLICDVRDPHGRGVDFIYDKPNRKLAGVRYEGIIPTFKWFSTEYQDVHQRLNSRYSGFIHDIVDVDESNNRFVIHQWSDVNLGNVGIYDASQDEYMVMFHFNESLNSFTLSPTKSVVVEAEDGGKIPCYINLPVDTHKDAALPLVVMPHGGPWARDYWELDPFVQFFTSRGYAVLRVNYRGSSGFGKDYLLAGIENLDKIMIDDIAIATEYALKNFTLNKQRVYIYGHSYGGYATYMSLFKYPKLYRAGVAVSAPSDIKKWLKEKKKSNADFTVDFWERALGNKSSSYLKTISPITYADKISNPLMIFHGKYDRTISVEQSREMAEALEKAGKRVWLDVLQREGHSIRDGNSISYLLSKTDKFFKKY